MASNTDHTHAMRTTARLPTVRESELIKRNTLFPVKSTPAKTATSVGPANRNKVVSSASKAQRDVSFNRRPKTNHSSFISNNSSPQSNGRRTMVASSGNPGNQQVKIHDPIKKPTTAYSTFTERLSNLQQHSILPNYEPSRSSQKSYGFAKAFGVCTNIGLIRDYNEDRVSIVLDIPRPATDKSTDPWPSCSLFALFDGHGGSKCADFLRNNLHYYIAKSKFFPKNPEEVLKEACDLIEKKFIDTQVIAAESGKYDTSGSCGLIMLTIGDTCYIANVGDSRAVISKNGGKIKQALTRDHKPSDEIEKTRVVNAGGKIYQNFPTGPTQKPFGTRLNPIPQLNNGPCRILPGGLAVSRAFGDIEAKLPQFGGNPDVLIAKPDITTVKITDMTDFIVLGSDGIYDVMTDSDVAKSVWETVEKRETIDIHEMMRLAAENLVKEALLQKSFDNVTTLIVAFPALEQRIKSPPPMLTEPEVKESVFMTPKPTPPKKKEAPLSESSDHLNMSPPAEGTTQSKFHRPCKTSPSKTLVTPPRRALFKKDSGKKDFETPKNKERAERKSETLPRIIPKINTRKSVPGKLNTE